MASPQRYAAGRGGGGFAEKSVQRILKALRHLDFTDRSKSVRRGRTPRALTAPSALLALPALVAFIALVSLSPSGAFETAALAAALAAAALLPGPGLRRALAAGLAAAAVALVIVLPARFLTPGYPLPRLPLRVFVSVTAAGALGSAYRWDELTSALGRLRLPGLLILILDLTVRYIYLLGRFSLDMLYALKLRLVGPAAAAPGPGRDGGAKPLGGVAGTMYLRSRELSSETRDAMEVRCFDGDYRRAVRRGFSAGDLLLALGLAAVVGLFIWY